LATSLIEDIRPSFPAEVIPITLAGTKGYSETAFGGARLPVGAMERSAIGDWVF
jgi:hypothetical protein